MTIGNYTIDGCDVYEDGNIVFTHDSHAEAIELARDMDREDREREEEEERWEEWERQDAAAGIASRTRDLMLDLIWNR